jgi:hypothetical protein
MRGKIIPSKFSSGSFGICIEVWCRCGKIYKAISLKKRQISLKKRQINFANRQFSG